MKKKFSFFRFEIFSNLKNEKKKFFSFFGFENRSKVWILIESENFEASDSTHLEISKENQLNYDFHQI